MMMAIGIRLPVQPPTLCGLFGTFFSSLEQTRDPRAQGSRLCPSSICEGRVVGCGRGEVPVLVSLVKTCTMPAKGVSGNLACG